MIILRVPSFTLRKRLCNVMQNMLRQYGHSRYIVKEPSVALNISLFVTIWWLSLTFYCKKLFFTLLNIILTDGRTSTIINIPCTWICTTSKLFFYYHKCPQENCGSIKQRVWLHPMSFKQDSIFRNVSVSLRTKK